MNSRQISEHQGWVGRLWTSSHHRDWPQIVWGDAGKEVHRTLEVWRISMWGSRRAKKKQKQRRLPPKLLWNDRRSASTPRLSLKAHTWPYESRWRVGIFTKLTQINMQQRREVLAAYFANDRAISPPTEVEELLKHCGRKNLPVDSRLWC